MLFSQSFNVGYSWLHWMVEMVNNLSIGPLSIIKVVEEWYLAWIIEICIWRYVSENWRLYPTTCQSHISSSLCIFRFFLKVVSVRREVRKKTKGYASLTKNLEKKKLFEKKKLSNTTRVRTKNKLFEKCLHYL